MSEAPKNFPADYKWGDRMPLGGRRQQETFKVYAGTVETRISEWLISAGYTSPLSHGRLAEIFIASGKSGTDVNHMAIELAIITSLALQFGCPPDIIRNAMPKNEKNEMQGVLGAIFEALELRMIADGKKVKP